MRRSPWSSLGLYPSRELSARCRLGVPAEVWKLCLHPLQQPWARIPMPVWGEQGRSSWHCRANWSPACSSQNAALRPISSNSHAAVLLSFHPAVHPPGL